MAWVTDRIRPARSLGFGAWAWIAASLLVAALVLVPVLALLWQAAQGLLLNSASPSWARAGCRASAPNSLEGVLD